MNLIFLYGPPAVGKLTIAQELAKLTDYKLYHNHLATDLVESVFARDMQDNGFFSLIADVNLFMVNKAIEHNIDGLIMTSCYIHPDEDKYIDSLKKMMRDSGNTINFVQIVCDEKQLVKRVVTDSRKKFGKLQDVKLLLRFIKEKDLYHKIKSPHGLSINNSNISARQVAINIKKYYQL